MSVKIYAYPKTLDPDEVQDTKKQNGMTLVDYFAGQALCGFLASMPEGHSVNDVAAARICYDTAEAMIAARKARGL